MTSFALLHPFVFQFLDDLIPRKHKMTTKNRARTWLEDRCPHPETKKSERKGKRERRRFRSETQTEKEKEREECRRPNNDRQNE